MMVYAIYVSNRSSEKKVYVSLRIVLRMPWQSWQRSAKRSWMQSSLLFQHGTLKDWIQMLSGWGLLCVWYRSVAWRGSLGIWDALCLTVFAFLDEDIETMQMALKIRNCMFVITIISLTCNEIGFTWNVAENCQAARKTTRTFFLATV